LRIARILTRLNLGGPARQALASDPVLGGRGHVVHVFTGSSAPGEGDLFDDFVSRGIHVERVPGLARGLSVAGDLRALHALRRSLVAFAPDIVHTHASKAGAIGRRAARKVPTAKRVKGMSATPSRAPSRPWSASSRAKRTASSPSATPPPTTCCA
jgi:hypothetical protein